MLEAIPLALGQLVQPDYLLYLGIGVALGLAIGIMPGIGGSVALALVLPFALTMPSTYILVVAIGALALTSTGDSITAILVGIPGTAGGAATIVDGAAMAKKGEAARALSTAFLCSIIGGILGGLFLIVAIPLFTPIIMTFGSPELFMLCVLGLTCVGLLSGRMPLKGVVAAAFGILLAMVGTPPIGGYEHRFALGTQYLWSGIPLVPALLGLYALPEVADMITTSSHGIVSTSLGKGWLQGVVDTFKNWWLLLRCSGIGIFMGFLPGVGSSVATWVAYAHAVQSAKDKSGFGKGDVRGVIAPECANNACKGGDLVPTIFFGVPGSGAQAILLVMMLMIGITPGPDMLTKELDVTLLIAFSLIAANIVGGIICFFLARPLAYVSLIPPSLLAAFVLLITMAGAWQVTQHWGDLVVFLVLGIVGWTMKHTGFSRPACVVGLVLGEITERYLFITLTRYGWRFLLDPWVMGLGLLVLVVVFTAVRAQIQRKSEAQSQSIGN